MLYKCGGCRRFFWITLVRFHKCDSCNYVATRCPECGGEKAARRSVMAHVSWYRTTGLRRGHADFHDPEVTVRAPRGRRANSPLGRRGIIRLAA